MMPIASILLSPCYCAKQGLERRCEEMKAQVNELVDKRQVLADSLDQKCAPLIP